MLTPDERKLLLDSAKKLHLELRAFTQRVDIVINKLLSEYDATKLAALDEASAADAPVVKQVKFKGEAPSLAVHPGAVGDPAPKLAPGKRACSICRRPGHRAQNCPQADAHFKAQRGKGKKK